MGFITAMGTRNSFDKILATASDALGVRLSSPVDLGGSARSAVLRCDAERYGSVVVKAFDGTANALRCFTAEASGLSLGLASPQLLAVDMEHPLLVMTDLGNGPTLQEILLGNDAGKANDALLIWARDLGQLVAASVGKHAELAALQERFDKGHPPFSQSVVPDWVTELPAALETAGIKVPAGLADDLAEICAIGDLYPGFTPGDTCADNNLFTPSGLRFLDFEGAGFQSVFLTAAYSRMPFATCWCVFRIPSDIATEMEREFRAQLLDVYPDLSQDAIWNAGMRRAIAGFTADTTNQMLRSAIDADGSMHHTHLAPTVRQLLVYRWENLGNELRLGSELMSLAGIVQTLLEQVAAKWKIARIPFYPAFQKSQQDCGR